MHEHGIRQVSEADLEEVRTQNLRGAREVAGQKFALIFITVVMTGDGPRYDGIWRRRTELLEGSLGFYA